MNRALWLAAWLAVASISPWLMGPAEAPSLAPSAAELLPPGARVAEVGLGDGLGAFGVNESQLDALSEQAFADACHETNPVPVTRADLRALYEAAM